MAFHSLERTCVQQGRHIDSYLVTAPPGAMIDTPRSPSRVGPTDDHVKLVGGTRDCIEYAAVIRLCVTIAPTPMQQEDVPPGQPTVLIAGPLLPDRKSVV